MNSELISENMEQEFRTVLPLLINCIGLEKTLKIIAVECLKHTNED